MIEFVFGFLFAVVLVQVQKPIIQTPPTINIEVICSHKPATPTENTMPVQSESFKEYLHRIKETMHGNKYKQ